MTSTAQALGKTLHLMSFINKILTTADMLPAIGWMGNGCTNSQSLYYLTVLALLYVSYYIVKFIFS